jgi:hypothetical protein
VTTDAPDSDASDYNKVVTALVFNLNRLFVTMEKSHSLFFSDEEANQFTAAGLQSEMRCAACSSEQSCAKL